MGKKLKELMNKKNINAVTLSEILGKKDRQSVYNLQRQQYFAVKTAKDIADYANIPLTYFFSESEKEESFSSKTEKDVRSIFEEMYIEYMRLIRENSELKNENIKLLKKLAK